MDFFRTKQPIALPVDSEDDKLLEANKGLDPELAGSVPQPQQRGKRCCFAKGSKGRKAIRLVGAFVVLGAFFHWFWRPSPEFRYGGHNLEDMKFSDFTDLDGIHGVPEDFLWVGLPLSRYEWKANRD
jgi:hypothetical protein